MGSGLISIAMTGINAAQTGLLTTSNNIANMSAEGYTRQRIVQASNPTVMTGAGGIGQGTHVVTVERMYNQALNKQVLSARPASVRWILTTPRFPRSTTCWPIRTPALHR